MVFLLALLFPALVPFNALSLLILALILGSLASPTDPAATLAVIHQYKAKGKVSDTILGISALDDVLGILLFSLTIAVIFMLTGGQIGLFGNPVINSLYQVFGAISIGVSIGFIIHSVANFLKLFGEGQWVVILFSIIIFCVGISKALKVDLLLSSMSIGVVVVNKCKQQKVIFRILERYIEEFIILIFFLLSGLHLNISTLPEASILIFMFVILRTIGKFIGAYFGARLVNANPSIQKYTAGALLPQAGIVIGMVLIVYQVEEFKAISEIILTTIMGASILHELIGPLAAKYSLEKAGEINNKLDKPENK